MKRYLICSDIHGHEEILESVLKTNRPLDGVIISGDLEIEVYDLENLIRRLTYPEIDIRMVSGNCDIYAISSASSLRNVIVFNISPDHRVFLTHGHRYRASHVTMSYAADDNECDIVIYGHTHTAVDVTEYGKRFINPGALMARSYMIMTIDDEQNIDIKHYG